MTCSSFLLFGERQMIIYTINNIFDARQIEKVIWLEL